MNDRIYPWKRFWCPREGEIRITDEGFLYDPEEEYAKYYQKDVVPFEQISNKPCLALLGEPGIGKTYAIQSEYNAVEESIKETPEQSILFDLSEFGNEDRLIREIFNSEKFLSWKDSSHVLHLFLDSLDECSIEIHNVAKILISQLNSVKKHIQRLRLRIACRTADWPNVLEQSLPNIWRENDENDRNACENVGIYELAPLRENDVKVAAETSGVDADSFIKEINNLEAGTLANRPITLKFLISTFKKDKQLPRSREELYERGCRIICEEQNPSRLDLRRVGGAGEFTVEQRLALASRVAAVVIFCRKPTVYTSTRTRTLSQDEIDIAGLAGDHELTGEDRLNVTEDSIREVLGTGLFSGRGPDQMGFAHQTYAEFLAARYLVTHNLDLTQIISVLVHKDDPEGRVVPQLIETVARIASLNNEVFGKIASTDPQVLLKGDASSYSEKDRSTLVQSMMRLFEEGKLNTREFSLYHKYHKLAHPRLAEQLRPYIEDKSKSIVVREVAIDIAEVCKLSELQGLLANIALDQIETNRIREAASIAIYHIGDDSSRRRLRPLALGEGGDDPEDRLKGCALRALWPNIISAEELFNLIIPAKKEFGGGIYNHFLTDEVVEHLKPEELPIALSWVEQQICGRRIPYFLRIIIDEIIIFAWKHIDRTDVLVALSRVCMKMFENHKGIIDDTEKQKGNEKLFSNSDKRHDMVEAILNLCEDFDKIDHGFIRYFPRLVRDEDLSWILEKLKAEQSGEKISRWSALAKHAFFNYQIPGHLDMILEASKVSKELHEEFGRWFNPVELNSEEARKMKEAFEEEKEWKEERRRSENPPMLEWLPKDRIQHRLECLEKGDLNAWIDLCADITLEDNSQRYENMSDLDITNTPGWRKSDENTRKRTLDTSVTYVTKKPSDPLKWIRCPHSYNEKDLAPYKALFLLKKISPDQVYKLPPIVWRKWIPTLLGIPFYEKERKDNLHLELLKVAYELWPNEFIFILQIQIDAQNHKRKILSVHEKLKRCWDDRLCQAVLDKAKEPHIIPNFFLELLEVLIRNNYNPSIEYAKSLLQTPIPVNDISRERARKAAIALLSLTEDACWDVVWPVINSDSQFGKELMLEAGHDIRRGAVDFAQRLNENNIADIYIWIVKQFPFSEDPQHDGAYSPGERDNVARLRDDLLRILENLGTPESVCEIERISSEFSELTWIRSVLVEARKNMLRNTWAPPEPGQFLELTRLPGSRLVQSAKQLQDVLIESLQRLETELQGETPAAPDLWDKIDHTRGQERYRPKDENSFSDYVKRYLERNLQSCGIVALREVQIRRGVGSGTGENTDIHVTAIVPGITDGAMDRYRVIIESKGCWHQELENAMQTQLVERYLKNNECRYGIYLVGWYACTQCNYPNCKTNQCKKGDIECLRGKLANQAKDFSQDDLRIKSYVINAALR